MSACLRSDFLSQFGMLVWDGYAVLVCVAQTAGLVGSVLQLQHGTRAALSGDCGHQLHQLLHPEQGLLLN